MDSACHSVQIQSMYQGEYTYISRGIVVLMINIMPSENISGNLSMPSGIGCDKPSHPTVNHQPD